MLLAAIIVVVLVAAFGGVLLFGAPYVPTLNCSAKAALELLDLAPGRTLLELGSGDGKMLVAAAQAGLKVVGIELNPFLVVISWLRTRRYRTQVKIVWGNFWQVEWPECDGVYVFLLDRFMPKLDERMKVVRKPLASLAFKIPGRKAAAEKSGVYLYQY